MVSLTCPTCRALVDAAPGIVSRCPHCQNTFTAPPAAPPAWGYAQPPVAPAPTKKGMSTGWIIAIVVICVVGVPALVVIAATVFVLTADLGDLEDRLPPSVQFQPLETSDRLLVTSASSNADWSRLEVAVESCASRDAASTIFVGGAPGTTHVNMAPGSTGNTPLTAADCRPTSGARASPTTQKMREGDFLEFCAEATGTRDVRVVVRDVVADREVYVYRFLELAAC